MNINGYIKKSLADEWRQLEKEMKKVEAAQRSEEAPRFTVRIHSFWSDCDEKDTEANGKGLEGVIKRAEERFLEINHRSDVQGQYFVFAQVEDFSLSLPSSLWDHLTLRNKGKK